LEGIDVTGQVVTIPLVRVWSLESQEVLSEVKERDEVRFEVEEGEKGEVG
jgi:hypothetical protein